MIPIAFQYTRPHSLDEALAELAAGGKLLAGGQSLLPLLKLRLATVDRLIDISRVDELKGVRDTGDGGIAIGALTTYRELLDSTLATERFPMLAEAVRDIGDIQVRNRGTVGGALAHCDPSSDLPAVVLALDGVVVLRSSSGERSVPAGDFFEGAFATACRSDEILSEVRLPASPAGAGAAYRNVEQPASGYSMVGVAAVVGHAHGVYGSSTFDHVRVAITGVSDTPYRATAVEDALVGTGCTPDVIREAAKAATEGRTVNGDIHADAEYRAAMAEVYVRRALEAARARSS